MKYNILIFPCASNVANEIVNSLKNNKHFKCYGGTSVEIKNPQKYQEIIDLPFISNPTFKEKLINACKTYEIDIIIPTHDGVALELSKIHNEIPVKIVGQNSFVNEIVRDKYKTYQYFQDKLPIAKIYDTNNIEYPLFIKPRVGEGSKGTRMIKTKEEMNLFVNEFNIDEFITMEYLTGEEYTIDCFSYKNEVVFIGPRTREGTVSGAALISNIVTDENIVCELKTYADIISKELGLEGYWFFQMKKSKLGKLKLLEISTRMAGTAATNRVRGINFVELSLYNVIGNNIDICINNFNMGIYRESKICYSHGIEYDNLYIDFDDTLVLENKIVNTDLIKLIYQARNEDKKVILLTKNNNYSLTKKLLELRLFNLFDDIIHIPVEEKKHNYMDKKSILIDDSFVERKTAIDNGYIALGLDNFEILIK